MSRAHYDEQHLIPSPGERSVNISHVDFYRGDYMISRWESNAELTGALTYVLGGGAALGARQLGHLRALERANLVPAALMGSSVGALNAAVVAADPSRASERLRTLWDGLRRADVFPWARRPPWGCGSILAPDGLRRLVTRALDDLGCADFRDLAVPLAVVATDAATGAPTVLEGGPLAPALLATAAIPHLFPPVRIAGHLLIDGGYSSLLPVDVAAWRGASTILALPAASPDYWSRRRAARALVKHPHPPTQDNLPHPPVVIDLAGRRPLRWRGCIGFQRTNELIAIGLEEATAALSARTHYLKSLTVDRPGGQLATA